jgi:outer membrane beta-barrel protein
MTSLARATITGAFLSLFCGIHAPIAFATNPMEDLPAVKNKQLLHDGRHALTPIIGITFNDAYSQNILLGASWRYYFSSWIGVGADVFGGVGFKTELADQIVDELGIEDQPFSLYTSSLQFLAHGTVEVVPVEGKFMLWSQHQISLDMHLLAGVGIAMVAGEERIDDSMSVMPIIGAGLRIFPMRWMAVGLEIRDFIIDRVLSTRRDGSVPSSSFGHNWLANLTVSFFLPMEPEIRP